MRAVADAGLADRLARRTLELIDIASESGSEGPLAAHVAGLLGARDLGDTCVLAGHGASVLLAGHLDTVPAQGNRPGRLDGDHVTGLGASDMKGALAVMIELALAGAGVDCLFFGREERPVAESALSPLLARERLDYELVVMMEPTGAVVEAGCQGTLRLAVTLAGRRAHTARPWMGVNAVHRLGELLSVVAGFDERSPVLDGCTYREALQAVRVEGGVAGNVVPDRATVELNHRFAPDRTAADAEVAVRSLLGRALGEGDTVELTDSAEGAPPGLDHPLLRALVEVSGGEVRAKLGWTDVARFAAAGIPACNFGPGDPTLAHHPDEHVARAEIESVHATLSLLLAGGY